MHITYLGDSHGRSAIVHVDAWLADDIFRLVVALRWRCLQLERFGHILRLVFNQIGNKVQLAATLQNIVMRKGWMDGRQHAILPPRLVIIFQIEIMILVTKANVQGRRSQLGAGSL